MQYGHKKHMKYLLGLCSPIIRFLNNVNVDARGQVIVLVLHNVPLEEMKNCATLLERLKGMYPFLNPKDFDKIMTGEDQLRGRHLMLTFDDGFHSNRVVAERILAPLKIKALFFVSTGFIECESGVEAKQFAAKKMFTNRTVNSLPDSMRSMNWADLKWLVDSGHTLGSHTENHVRLSYLRQQADAERELILSGDRIEQELGIKVEHFAFPFGVVECIDPLSLAIAGSRYSYVFSSVRGANRPEHTHRLAIRRETLSLSDSMGFNVLIATGGLSFYYRKRRQCLDQMAREAVAARIGLNR